MNDYGLLIPVVIFTVEFLGILSAAHAVMNARSSQGAVAWAISLITFPYVTLPLYWTLGLHKFHGYVEAYRTVGGDYYCHIQQTFYETSIKFKAILPHPLASLPRTAKALAWVPFTCGNATELLIDGEQTYRTILEAIQEAQDYILVQYYIVHDDGIGNQLKQALLAKAKEQVRIYFLYDELGCYDLPDKYLDELCQGGIQITVFSSIKRIGHRFQINFRNHRKIVIVDGKIAFLGGLNVGDEYLGKEPEIGAWRDTHLKLEGPSVQYLQISFLQDWYWATQQLPEGLLWEPQAAIEKNVSVLILPTGPADELSVCTLFFVSAFNLAKRRLWIASPYFVPDEVLVTALQMAALRGVDVRILMPDKADHRIVQLASYSYYDEMLSVGVKLYRYQAGFLHQKAILIDDDLASVGTVNLDNRSFNLNFEITAFIMDTHFVNQVEKMFLKDFDRSYIIMEMSALDEKPLWFHVAIHAARLMAPLL